jgi:hypothetical protein
LSEKGERKERERGGKRKKKEKGSGELRRDEALTTL